VVYGRKQTIVGDFFEKAIHSFIGGDLARNEEGDIVLREERTTIEVKSSGHQSWYGFRLEVDQIDRNRQLSFFPFDRALYFFVAYQNGRKSQKGKRRTELSRCTTLKTIHPYLATKVQWCAVVDLSIIERWRKFKPHSTKSVVGHLGRLETVNIPCSEVAHLINGGFTEVLKSLKLQPKSYRVIRGNVSTVVKPNLLEYPVQFPLTAVLRAKDYRAVQEILLNRPDIEICKEMN
jgi:hypothetical protein